MSIYSFEAELRRGDEGISTSLRNWHCGKVIIIYIIQWKETICDLFLVLVFKEIISQMSLQIVMKMNIKLVTFNENVSVY